MFQECWPNLRRDAKLRHPGTSRHFEPFIRRLGIGQWLSVSASLPKSLRCSDSQCRNEPAMLALLVTSKVGASGTAAGSSAGLGVTRSSPASSAINTGAAPASTGRGSSTAGAQSGFNNGAASLSHLAPWAIAALGAIAGAVVVL